MYHLREDGSELTQRWGEVITSLRITTFVVLLFSGISLPQASAGDVYITIEKPVSPPTWALLERELLRSNTVACEEFFDRYFDERGFLVCIERWGGNDWPDDAPENLTDWPILHALGAPDVILNMYKKAWEGHLVQYGRNRSSAIVFLAHEELRGLQE